MGRNRLAAWILVCCTVLFSLKIALADTSSGIDPGALSTLIRMILANSPPVASPDTVTCSEDASKSILLTGSDPEKRPLTYQVLTAPLHGVISGTAPNLVYAPQSNFNGLDSFTFRVYDGEDYSTPASINIIVAAVPDAPVPVAAAGSRAYLVGGTVYLDGSGSADADGDILTYLWTIISAPPGSSAGLNSPASPIPSFTADLAGDYLLRLTVSDGQSSTSTDITVRVVTWYSEIAMGLPDSTSENGVIPVEDSVVGQGLVAGRVNILLGNMVETRSDLAIPAVNTMGLTFGAVYNSRSTTLGANGQGWTHTYEVRLEPGYRLSGTDYLKITDNTGRALYFLFDTSTGRYSGQFGERSQVTLDGTDYLWQRLDGSNLRFDANGRLTAILDKNSNQLILTYSATNNRLLSVTDSTSGRKISFNYRSDGLLSSVTGPVTQAIPDRIWVRYIYNSATKNLTYATYPDGSGFVYNYGDANDNHNITAVKNRAGHTVSTFTYDNLDRCKSSSNQRGAGISMIYVNDAQVDVMDAYSVSRSYSIGSVGLPKRVTALAGNALLPYDASTAIRWQYDNSLNLIEIEYGGGRIDQYQGHDSHGNPATVILAAGSTAERKINYTWHARLNTILSRTEKSANIPASNKVTTVDYDNDGNDISNQNPTMLAHRLIEKGITLIKGSDSFIWQSYTYITVYSYSDFGRLVGINGPNSGDIDTTTMTYDPSTGDILSTTAPGIGTTMYEQYDAAGRPGMVTDPNNQAIIYTYDARGRVVSIKQGATGPTSTTIYNSAGLPEKVANEDGVETSYLYGPVTGLLSRIKDMNANYTAYTYDAQGNLIKTAVYDAHSTPADETDDSLVSVSEYSYQHPVYKGRLFQEKSSDGKFTEYNYDAAGNIFSIKDPDYTSTDPDLHFTTFGYDLFNRQISVTRNLKQNNGTMIPVTESRAYNSQGNIKSITDGKGVRTDFLVDDMGRVVAVNSPDLGGGSFSQWSSYNVDNNTVTKGDNRYYSMKVIEQYDNSGRVVKIDTWEKIRGNWTNIDKITFTYDEGVNGKGRRTGMTDLSGGSTTWEYDGAGRATAMTTAINGKSYRISRTFTDSGAVNTFTYPNGPGDPNGRLVIFERNNNLFKVGAIKTSQNGIEKILVSELVYRPFGGASSMKTGANETVVNQDSCGCGITKAGLDTPFEREFVRDGNRNLTGVRHANYPDLDVTYSYDTLGRLTGYSGLLGKIDFSYDNNGNRLSQAFANNEQNKRVAERTETSKYTNNRLTVVKFSEDKPGDNYSYDLNLVGNITSVSSFRTDEATGRTKNIFKLFGYDAVNQLISFKETMRFVDSQDSSTITTEATYVYNGLKQRVSKTVNGQTTLFLHDFDGNIIAEADGATGAITKEYIYSGSTRLAMVDVVSDKIFHYVNGQHGMPMSLVDENNTPVWSAQYYPFGEAVIAENPIVEQNFRFPGQYYDKETGLHYNWHRYYDPSTGRYLTPDPIGLDGGMNLFAYAEGNPISLFDKTGLAYFALRPLAGLPWLPGGSHNPIDDFFNTEIAHEQIFFEDGNSPSNIGFTDKNKLETEKYTSGYRITDTGYNDCVMRMAVDTAPRTKYCALGKPGSINKFNCQDWADAVRKEYKKLLRMPNVRQQCCIQ